MKNVDYSILYFSDNCIVLYASVFYVSFFCFALFVTKN